MRSRLSTSGRIVAILATLAAAAATPGCTSPAPGARAPTTTAVGATLPPTLSPTSSGATRPHILVIMEENRGYAQTLGSCSTDSPDPYFCSLASQYASSTHWYGVEHPSQPNYIDIASGADQGCTSDTCSGLFSATDLGGQLTAAHIPWATYMESMPAPCFTGESSGEYAHKHNPFIVFADVAHASNCSTVELPYPGAVGLAAALDAANAPDFVWISPNLLDDMHDGSIQQGDVWLRTNLSPILSSPWFADHGTVIITMDENDVETGGSCCGDAAGGQLPMVVISENSRGKGSVGLTGDHFGTLRSIEEVYGLPRLGAAGNAANGDLGGLFG